MLANMKAGWEKSCQEKLYNHNYWYHREVTSNPRMWTWFSISPVLLGFQPPNFTQLLLQPSSTRMLLKPHPPINSHNTQLAATCPDWDKCFPTWNGCCAGQEDCFLNPFVHRRTAVAHSEPTKVFPKQSPQTAMLSALFGCTHHLPLSHPFC